MPDTGCEYTVVKGKYQIGLLHVLLEKQGNKTDRFWVNLSSHPDLKENFADELQSMNIRIVGSKHKYVRKWGKCN